MKCQICGADPLTDNKVVLTRQNEKGLIGVWACEKHMEHSNLCGCPVCFWSRSEYEEGITT